MRRCEQDKNMHISSLHTLVPELVSEFSEDCIQDTAILKLGSMRLVLFGSYGADK